MARPKLVLVFLILSKLVSAQNESCSVNKLIIPTDPMNIRTIYQYNCASANHFQPTFPALLGSFPVEFNEIDLSPNFYTSLPVNELCKHRYIYLLDMSFNLLKNLTGAFVQLRCLNSLASVDFSNNLIATPIRHADFDDSLAARLKFINLSGNKISSVETSAFIYPNGSSRFSQLAYLNLARNAIKELDLLFPLTFPGESLKIELQLNPIDRLVNQLGLSFKHPAFGFEMSNARVLDATNNQLQYLDDSNLLQYGLVSREDLETFLNKIANYDLRQSNLVRTFICYCPPQGLQTVSWFKSFSSSVRSELPIYQLFCSNFEGSVYVLDFTCERTNQNTTTEVTSDSTRQSSSVSVIAKLNEASNDPALLLSDIGGSTQPPGASKLAHFFAQKTNYYYLILLVVAFLVISIMVFMCCLGRCCQVCVYNRCSLLLCPCFRPNDHSLRSGKIYDMTICYTEYDEHWINDQFMPVLSNYDRGYKIHKLSLYHRSNWPISEENQRILLLSKRIILMFSEKFMREEWNNKSFRDLIGRIYRNDEFCVIVAICLGEVSSRQIHKSLKELSRLESSILCGAGCCNGPVSRLKYTCGLKEAEVLSWADSGFWAKFNYMMPVHTYDEITRISGSSKGNSFTLPRLNMEQSKRVSIGSYSHSSSSTYSNNEQSLLAHEPKKKPKRHKNARKASTNIATTSGELSDSEHGSRKSTSSELRQFSSVRHLVVPLPEEMRTEGFRAKAYEEKEFSRPTHLPPINANILTIDHSMLSLAKHSALKRSNFASEHERQFSSNNRPSATPEIFCDFVPINSSRTKSRNRSRSSKSDLERERNSIQEIQH